MSVADQFERVLSGVNYQVMPLMRPGIQAYAQNVDGRPALLVRVDNTFARSVDGTNGIDVRVDGPGIQNRCIRFESESVGFTPMFAAIVNALLDEVPETEPVDGLVDRYEELRLMFAHRTGRLSESAIRGLVAELLLLLELREGGYSATAAVHAWQGPYRVAKDFVLPGGRSVEVKSIRRVNRRVRISSVEQLADRGEDLRLAVLPLESAAKEDGTGLLELLNEVHAWMHAEQTARLPYAQAIASLGVDVDDPYYERWVYARGDWKWFKIAPGFPRIDQAAVPAAVSSVSFSLDTDRLDEYSSRPFWEESDNDG